MTTQIEDRLRHKGNDYSIVAVSSPIPFNPLDYGVKPWRECLTACDRDKGTIILEGIIYLREMRSLGHMMF